MNIETISMPVEEAKEKLAAYKSKLAKMKIGKANSEIAAEYKAAMEGYKLLAKGTRLLDLQDVFKDCPRGEDHRPKLAIARADRKGVEFLWPERTNNYIFYSGTGWINKWQVSNSTLPSLDIRILVTDDNRFDAVNDYAFKDIKGHASVPMIPATVEGVFDRSKHFILWEVEKWADSKSKAEPDRDPYLLKHLSGHLYAVVAEWDLTDLERSIMKGRI